MILKEIVKPKSELTTISETATLEEALDILESSGFRCVPVLDKTGKLFRGNIYKMHIYRHKSRGGDMQLPVTQLLKNASKFISIDSAFFNIFFTIKDLPYIAVLDENNNFYGILTHSSLLNTLSQSWNVNNGSYVLTVLSSGDRGDLAKISKIITRYSSIASCISLDLHESNNIQRILFTLPSNVDEHRLKRIVASLKRNKFEVTEIENLHA